MRFSLLMTSCSKTNQSLTRAHQKTDLFTTITVICDGLRGIRSENVIKTMCFVIWKSFWTFCMDIPELVRWNLYFVWLICFLFFKTGYSEISMMISTCSIGKYRAEPLCQSEFNQNQNASVHKVSLDTRPWVKETGKFNCLLEEEKLCYMI